MSLGVTGSRPWPPTRYCGGGAESHPKLVWETRPGHTGSPAGPKTGGRGFHRRPGSGVAWSCVRNPSRSTVWAACSMIHVPSTVGCRPGISSGCAAVSVGSPATDAVSRAAARAAAAPPGQRRVRARGRDPARADRGAGVRDPLGLFTVSGVVPDGAMMRTVAPGVGGSTAERSSAWT